MFVAVCTDATGDCKALVCLVNTSVQQWSNKGCRWSQCFDKEIDKGSALIEMLATAKSLTLMITSSLYLPVNLCVQWHIAFPLITVIIPLSMQKGEENLGIRVSIYEKT